jgi:hypothetical protein
LKDVKAKTITLFMLVLRADNLVGSRQNDGAVLTTAQVKRKHKRGALL